MKNIFGVITLFFLVACSSLHHKKSKLGYGRMSFQEISHGAYQINSRDTIADPNSPSGNHNIVNGITLLQETDTIIGKVGNALGVVYRFETDMPKNIELVKVWNFPAEMTDEKGNHFNRVERSDRVNTNSDTYTTYIFEKEFEAVPGPWRIRFFYKDAVIYDHTFIVVKPN